MIKLGRPFVLRPLFASVFTRALARALTSRKRIPLFARWHPRFGSINSTGQPHHSNSSYERPRAPSHHQPTLSQPLPHFLSQQPPRNSSISSRRSAARIQQPEIICPIALRDEMLSGWGSFDRRHECRALVPDLTANGEPGATVKLTASPSRRWMSRRSRS